MKSRLLELKQKKPIASFYMNREEPDAMRVGYVTAVNDEHFVLMQIGRYGGFDGYLLKACNRLLRVDENGIYERKIKALQEHYQTQAAFLDFPGANLPLELLQYALDNRLVVSVELLESGRTDIQGFAEELSDELCVFRILDDFGRDDGSTTCYLSDITEVLCNSLDEANVKALHEMRFS